MIARSRPPEQVSCSRFIHRQNMPTLSVATAGSFLFPRCQDRDMLYKARTTIPAIIRSHRTLTAVEIIFMVLRLSLFRTQTTDRSSPSKTKTIFKTAITVRTPSGRVIFKKAGISVATGRRLMMSAAMLKDFRFLFSIFFYLISFFPNCVTASANTKPNINTAQGRNGNSENAVLEDSAVKS